jgi:hypothetical protein
MLICYKEHNFRSSRLAQIETANEIIGDYQDQGYTLTLRQLYYQFVARGLIENTDASYNALGSVVADGREAGLISWDAIEDRCRGVKSWLIEEDQQEVLNGIEHGFALDFWSRQGVYVEVWVEKEALGSVIERPCNRMRVPYMSCKGYLSASEAWRSGRRFLEASERGDDCILIHLGDHDPSGIDMTRDNARRLEMFAEHPVEVRRIALNMDQVTKYRPPENPAKITDSRAADYIRNFGTKSWELDALEPKILDTLIDREINSLIDPAIWQDTKDEEADTRRKLSMFYDRFDEISEFLEGLE